MSELKRREVIYFGFKLNQTSAVIIFLLALTSIINIINLTYTTLYSFILTLQSQTKSGWLMSLINLAYISIILSINIYTLVICSRVKKYQVNEEYTGEHWFGFEMSTISATVLFLVSLIGIIGFFSFIYGNVYSLISLWDIYAGFEMDIIVMLLVPRLLSITIAVCLLAIDVYTIRKCLNLKRKVN